MKLLRSYCFVIGICVTIADKSLTLTNILKVKKAIENLSSCPAEKFPIQRRSDHVIDGPTALPLVLEERSDEPWNEKPTKLQTFFQVSVTALSFLAFGGYLLCMIVQAIKSKGTTYFHPVSTAMTATNTGILKKIKVYRRTRRATKRNETEAGPDPMELHQILKKSAEIYVAIYNMK